MKDAKKDAKTISLEWKGRLLGEDFTPEFVGWGGEGLEKLLILHAQAIKENTLTSSTDSIRCNVLHLACKLGRISFIQALLNSEDIRIQMAVFNALTVKLGSDGKTPPELFSDFILSYLKESKTIIKHPSLFSDEEQKKEASEVVEKKCEDFAILLKRMQNLCGEVVTAPNSPTQEEDQSTQPYEEVQEQEQSWVQKTDSKEEIKPETRPITTYDYSRLSQETFQSLEKKGLIHGLQGTKKIKVENEEVLPTSSSTTPQGSPTPNLSRNFQPLGGWSKRSSSQTPENPEGWKL